MFTHRFDQYTEMLRLNPGKPKIIAVGDSWFSYPAGNLLMCIEALSRGPGHDYLIYTQVKPGVEIRELVAGHWETNLKFAFRMLDTTQLILLSGGGNDFADNSLRQILKPRAAGAPWQDALDMPKVNQRFDDVENAYREFIDWRDQWIPNAPIMTHSYDYAHATGIGFLWWGPWLDAPLKEVGVVDEVEQTELLKVLVDQFERRLLKLDNEQGPDKFIFIKTTGTLVAADWSNELHPNKAGLEKLAAKFKPTMQRLFPGDTRG